jgi:hypothetical protein
MTKLHQVLALEKTRKNQAKAIGDEAYHRLQRHQLSQGLRETYDPHTEDDVPVEPKYQKVQVRAANVLDAYLASQVPAWDIQATKDAANMGARADVKIGKTVLLIAVPVTTLISLEKWLTDVRTVITHAPTLDPAEDWHLNAGTGLYETEPAQVVRTKKISKHEVVVPATDKHPAQVAGQTVDVEAGTWTKMKMSGALTETRQAELLGRANQLLEAVKAAREEANSIDITDVKIADTLFTWLKAGA